MGDRQAYAAAQSFFSAPRITILSASSGNGRCSAFASPHGVRIIQIDPRSVLDVEVGADKAVIDV